MLRYLAVFLIPLLKLPFQLKDDALAEQNDFIKQYLAEQQQLYQQQVEVRRQVQRKLFFTQVAVVVLSLLS